MNQEPPILGIAAIFAFGIATGFGAAFLVFTFAF